MNKLWLKLLCKINGVKSPFLWAAGSEEQMPHSLRARLSGLRYKKIISDKDYDRLCKALDNEGVLDKIRNEIEAKYGQCELCEYFEDYDYEENDISEYRSVDNIGGILKIIDKYKAEREHIGDIKEDSNESNV